MPELEVSPAKVRKRVLSHGAWICCGLLSLAVTLSNAGRSGVFRYGPGTYIPFMLGSLFVLMIVLLSVVATVTLLFRWVYGLFKKH